jgi:hypothetical protein
MVWHTLEGFLVALIISIVFLTIFGIQEQKHNFESAKFLEKDFFYRNFYEIDNDLNDLSLFILKTIELNFTSGKGFYFDLAFSGQKVEKSLLYLDGESNSVLVKINGNILFSDGLNGTTKIDLSKHVSEDNRLEINSSEKIYYLLSNFVSYKTEKTSNSFFGKLFSGKREISPKAVFLGVEK